MKDGEDPRGGQWDTRPGAGWREFQQARARLLRRLAEQTEQLRRDEARGRRTRDDDRAHDDDEERRPDG
jgi:hypothetical protein